MKFQQFPDLNDQHFELYNKLAKLPFTGIWTTVHEKVENPEELEA